MGMHATAHLFFGYQLEEGDLDVLFKQFSACGCEECDCGYDNEHGIMERVGRDLEMDYTATGFDGYFERFGLCLRGFSFNIDWGAELIGPEISNPVFYATQEKKMSKLLGHEIKFGWYLGASYG